MAKRPIKSLDTSNNPLHFHTLKKEFMYNSSYDKSLALWSVPYTTSYVPTSFGQTYVIACGPADGEPLVLLHAMGFSSTVWLPNIKQLAQTFRVYAIDYIGDLNKSIPNRVPENREHCGQWLDEVLNQLKIDACLLGGISYGGFLAIQYASYAASRVRRLFLLSPAGCFVPLHNKFIYRVIAMSALPMRWHVNNFIRWLSRHQLNPTLIEQFYAAYRYGSVSLKVSPSVYSDDELKKLTMPILLLLGDQEVISDPHLAYERATHLGLNIDAEIITGAGHMLNLEKPEYVNMRITEFLN